MTELKTLTRIKQKKDKIMDLPAFCMLCLEQENHALKDDTRDFLDLPCLTHFLDHWSWPLRVIRQICRVGAKITLFTICLTNEDNASPTTDPEPSQPSAMPAAEQPEPTAALETEPAIKTEPKLSPEATFFPEPEPNVESVQVCEPASLSFVEGLLVEFIGMAWSPATLPSLKVHKQSWVTWN